MQKLKAAIFYWLIRPILNRLPGDAVRDCPMCGRTLYYYEAQGYLHLSDGDADCYGALGYGKGGWK